MKAWTIMIFLAGDNDLEGAAYADLLEMTRAGQSRQVNVLVELDSRQVGTRRFELHGGQVQPVSTGLVETNSGDPAVLADFVRWGRANYPAERDMLVIWSHGTGWQDSPATFDWSKIRDAGARQTLSHSLFVTTIAQALRALNEAQAISVDACSRDYLDNRELRQALDVALNNRPLEILGLDACLMACVEIAYQMREEARFLVASQESEPNTGWPYDQILRLLYAYPEMSGRELAALIVGAYAHAGTVVRAPTKHTQSALDLGCVEQTKALIQALCRQLDAYPQVPPALRRAIDEASGARRGAKRFQDRDMVDFYDWLWQVRRRYRREDPALDEAVDQLMAQLTPGKADSLLVASSAVVGDDTAQVHGLSIYLPRYRRYNPLYQDLDFASSGWPRFARAVSEHVK